MRLLILSLFLFSFKAYSEARVQKYYKRITKNDRACIIAPAYGAKYENETQGLLESAREIVSLYELSPYFYEDLLAPYNHSLFSPQDLRFSNSDETRFLQLAHALHNNDCALIWCLRGGYGSVKLLKRLKDINEPQSVKVFIGFSDITILHSFLNKRWSWPTLHFGMPGALQDVMRRDDTIRDLQRVIFGEVQELVFKLEKVNSEDFCSKELTGVTSGGNIVNFARTFGTEFQVDFSNKIFIFEEVGEEARWLDGFLEQFELIPGFESIQAVIFGTISPLEKKGLFDKIIADFQGRVTIPVFKLYPEDTIGHGAINRALPLGTHGRIHADESCKNSQLFVHTGIEPGHDAYREEL